jgi:hypothetical protein
MRIPRARTGFLVKEFHNIRTLSEENLKNALKTSWKYPMSLVKKEGVE